MQEGQTTEEYVAFGEPESGQKTGLKYKFENFLGSNYFVPVLMVLLAIISFCLGRISIKESKKEPVRVLNGGGEVKGVSTEANTPQPPTYTKRGEEKNTTASTASAGAASINTSASTEQVVASKNGTKYHYPWCAGAKQISEKNKIIFNSIEEARAKGYTPAINCKGLK